MGIAVLVLGESGSGKSASLRNFKEDEIGIINVASKPLPFRTKLKTFNSSDYDKIKDTIKKTEMKTLVIDDSQYLMAFESFEKATKTGYNKFTEIAVNFKELIDTITRETKENVITYFLHHIETNETGKTKAKTIGKMLDNQITLEGLFSIVLLTEKVEDKHIFRTITDGTNTVKTPIGMFEEEKINNDLKFVDKKIREYYGFNESEEK